jgi:opacity protein-like surface antigen
MKTLIASAIVAATAISGAASAQQVNPGALAAIAHFNESREGGEVISLEAASNGTVSTRSGVSGETFDRFNADADSQDMITGLNGGTSYDGAPAYGADIFARIEAANSEDEG